MSRITASGDSPVLPLDTAVGDDADTPGISQPFTQAEIEDLVNDTTMPIEERVERLHGMAETLGTREEMDRGGEFDPLIEQINEALGLLADGGHTYGTPESVGLDPEYRSDARAPDDTDDRPL